MCFSMFPGYIAPWSGRFYSLWDTGYAKIHIPIIASVSEHQPTTWVSFFFDLHILVCVFPAGVWFVIKEINDERVFSKCPAFYSINILITYCNLLKIQRLFKFYGEFMFANFMLPLTNLQ